MQQYLNKFPPGYKFYPTDGELLRHYLNNKVLDMPLPWPKIKDVLLNYFMVCLLYLLLLRNLVTQQVSMITQG
ncbi:hypothetical protein Pint_17899 [Pistacia integerrima]|uniref:Uncharacterized protein n=1 Tax=Pistacia integerrima TaxID=434235 RepID=A0ACC0YYU3_9ROSI|nr:hypothetical protein Pint_17899 [Pistacia integerrima]